MRHDHAASELDALAVMPIAALHTSITALTTAVKVSVGLKYFALSTKFVVMKHYYTFSLSD